MTTTIIVQANHGWPVSVTSIDPRSARSLASPVTVEPGTQQSFYAHGGADLLIHEVQPSTTEPQPQATTHNGLPVAGYRPQANDKVELVNANKIAEEKALRILDRLAELPETDLRWLDLARSAIEQGFMCANRAIFRPGRVDLV